VHVHVCVCVCARERVGKISKSMQIHDAREIIHPIKVAFHAVIMAPSTEVLDSGTGLVYLHWVGSTLGQSAD